MSIAECSSCPYKGVGRATNIALDAYCAGVLDGEGHISLVSGRSPKISGASVMVGVTNTRLEMLEPFLKYGGKIYGPRRHGLGTKPIYQWHARSKDSFWVLARTYPFLRRLRKRAKAAMVILRNIPLAGCTATPGQKQIVTRMREVFHKTEAPQAAAWRRKLGDAPQATAM